MTADLLAEWWIHAISVERYAGSGAYGDTFDTAVDLLCFVDAPNSRNAGNRIVNANGSEVVSSQIVYLSADTADIPAGSRVTLPALFGGRTSTVVASVRRDGGPLGLPDHLEIALL